MKEIIKKYKDGLVGVCVYFVIILFFIFGSGHLLPFNFYTFAMPIISFFLFQYIVKPSQKPLLPIISTNNVGTLRLLSGFLLPLVVVIILLCLLLIAKLDAIKTESIINFGAILPLLIVSTIAILGSIRSEYQYFRTKDKRFRLVTIIFGISFLILVLLFN